MFKPIRLFTISLAMTAATPALADDQLERTLLGLGAQLILNQRQQQQPMMQQAPVVRQGTQQRQRTTTTAPVSSAQTRQFQQSLNALGYDAGQPDGQAGPQTQQAIMAWQQSIGAQPTGVLSRAQSRTLLSAANPSANSGPANPPRETLPRSDMAQLQRGLTLLGYYGGAADGLPGPKTANALSAYLRDRGQNPDAVRLHDAQAMILAESGVAPIPSNPAPESHAAGSGFAGSGASTPDLQLSTQSAAAMAAGPAGSLFADLPTFEGATLILGDQSPHQQYMGYRTIFGGDEARAKRAVAALDRLWYLYLLKGDPGRLDDLNLSSNFLFLLPEAEAARFGFAGGGWRGENQFEREDSHRAFLANWRDRLIAMTATLPEDLIFVSGAAFGNYDAARGTLALSGGSRTGSGAVAYADSGLKIPEPYSFPKEILTDAATARQLIGGAQADYDAQNPDRIKGSGIIPAESRVMQRYRVAGVRPADRQAVLDLIPVSIALYDLTLRTKLFDVPLPGGAAVVGNADGAPQLDALYPRLWMAKTMPSILDDPAFVAESFRLRRHQEAGQRPYSYEPIVSTAIRKTNLPATAQDLQTMRDWLQRHAKDLPTEVKASGFGLRPVYGVTGQGWRTSITEWLKPGGQPESSSGSERSWIGPALAAAAKVMPNAIGQYVLWSGNGVPTVVVLHPHPAWASGIPVDFEPMGEPASLDMKIVEARAVTDAGVPPFLMLDVLPVALSYQRDGKTTRVALDQQPTSSPNATRRFDVAGLRLDMPLTEAEPIARAFLEGTTTREEWVFQNGALTTAVALFTPNQRTRWKELLVLFYDDTLPEKPLIAIGRQVNTDEFASQEQGMAALLPRLEEKFGKSYKDGKTVYWAVDPVTVAMLEAGIDYTHPCSQNDYEQFFHNPVQPVRFSSRITKGCGEMLSLSFASSYVNQLLTDTNVLAARWAKMEAAKSPPPQPGAAIKF